MSKLAWICKPLTALTVPMPFVMTGAGVPTGRPVTVRAASVWDASGRAEKATSTPSGRVTVWGRGRPSGPVVTASAALCGVPLIVRVPPSATL